MEPKRMKSLSYYMRALHRDLGFFIIGLAIMYSISGIVLIYRDTDFLKRERQIEKQLPPDIKESDLGMTLRIRNFEIIKTEGDVIFFQNGTYNKLTGIAKYSEKGLPAFLEEFNKLHKTASGNVTHWISVIFGIVLLLLAISSFWMFKPDTKMFRRGIIIAGAGIIITLVFLFI
jgi:hypothetical protein